MQKLSTKEILKQNLDRSIPGQLGDLKILLHNVRSMHNVGATFRSADAFGIHEILISGYTPTPPRPEITKTAIGAEEYVEWQHVECDQLDTKISQLKGNGYRLVGLEQMTRSVLLPEYGVPKDRKICLAFGNEVTGLDEDLLTHIDDFVEIPQYGHKHSLNVSVTVGVALYAFLEKYW
ncbi:SpoU rRNA Methylase family protein [Fodinibius roseus]|uniref:SpoU rRNA Methylase family protein n=1 Tax=Fodinibius roseus TaxID=1194090 RepID=A0A1M5CCH9_9BACT|nr:TrmH family RNA methyltransferase [Fodinibius roseus]SHF52448.1 SpoU rRNA Methylase family protein [Fodinibius roseus]